MIVKDNRSPRGRYEESPRQGDALHGLKPIGVPMLGGKSWRDTTSDWLRMGRSAWDSAAEPGYSRQPKAAKVRVVEPVELVCEVCEKPFLAINRDLATTCGATCRKRRWRARQRAA